MELEQVRSLAWPGERSAEAVHALIDKAGLSKRASNLSHHVSETEISTEWIEDLASRAGCEAEQLMCTFGDLPKMLTGAYPALLRIDESFYLAVLKVGGGDVRVLTPALAQERLDLEDLRRALRRPAEADVRPALERFLDESGLNGRKRARALESLLEKQLANKLFSDCWVLRTDAGGEPGLLLRQGGVLRSAAGMLATHTLQYLAWLASWSLLGSLSLAGHMDHAWILAWALLLITLVPFQLTTTWLQGSFAVGLGTFLKKRLLCGAMKLRADEMRHGGIGTFLGQALEAEAVETLALSGGIAGFLATVEIVLAMFVLGRFAWVLAVWTVFAGYAAWRFLRRYETWTDTRMEMTDDLVETMVGYRTRLAQLERRRWHESEDQALDGYLGISKKLDRCGGWLIAAVPRTWLLAGLACLAPVVSAGRTSETEIGLALGGVLLAYTALRKLTGSFADIAAACVALRRIKPLFEAAAREEKLGEPGPTRNNQGPAVIEADRLSFRYRPMGKPVIEESSLVIREGDRILLEGPSGGGKTTFALLLSGLRQAESGLLLSNGLDRNTLGGRRWRERVAAAPQFHENHILTETLAFNLLLGRRWPPMRTDLEEAETICGELGLGPLLDSMPSGLMQMVGEGGWQLSHGEKSRVFIARALLQAADLVILDESFGALDPENTKLALQATVARSKTLMVIAHP